MDEKMVMKWGGISAFVWVVTWFIGQILSLSIVGIPCQLPTPAEWGSVLTDSSFSMAWILFGIGQFFVTIMICGMYIYLKKTSESLTAVWLIFIILFLAVWFVQLSVQNAGKYIAMSGAPDMNTQLAVVMNLHTSLTIPFLCFLGFGIIFAGLVLIRLEGINKAAGYLYFVSTLLGLLLIGSILTGKVLVANIIYLIMVTTYAIIHILMGLILTGEAKKV